MDRFRSNLKNKIDKYIKLNGISYAYIKKRIGSIYNVVEKGSTKFKTLFQTSKILNVDIRNLLMFNDYTYIFKNSFDTSEEFFVFLGKRLKNFRLSKELKILDISNKINISNTTISSFENARIVMSLDTFYKYLDVLEITPEEFFLKDEKYQIVGNEIKNEISIDDFNDRIYELEEIKGRIVGGNININPNTFPTLHVFLKICKSLRVSPRDFFDFGKKEFGEDFKIIDISNSANFIKQKLESNGVKVQRYIKLDAVFLFCDENNILIKDFFEKLCTDGKDNQMSMKLHGSLNIKGNDLFIGNIKVVDIAKKFNTPCYVMDENLIRENINRFKNSIGNENKVVYAGKTFLNTHMVKILKEENICLDVVSDGELYIAHSSGFNMEKIVFHGNNKSYDEIKMGVQLKAGRFVCDSIEELEILENVSKEFNRKSKVFIRVNLGIDAHTHEYIKTSCIDSKFGISKDIDKISNILFKYRNSCNIEIVGFHCHIGSQIFSKEAFIDEVDEMFKLINDIKVIDKNFEINELNLGGGFGIYYTKDDTPVTIEEYVECIVDRVNYNCSKFNFNVPKLYIEPGRSIVGNAGMTIYEIGNIKEIEGIRNYVSVDGGMTDNIRTALYGSDYECLISNKACEEKSYKATISGKCCESGDVLIRDAFISKPERGDILAIFSTGAYCHSMSSNYNKLRKPPIVFFYNDNLKLVTKRESFEDLIRLDV